MFCFVLVLFSLQFLFLRSMIKHISLLVLVSGKAFWETLLSQIGGLAASTDTYTPTFLLNYARNIGSV